MCTSALDDRADDKSPKRRNYGDNDPCHRKDLAINGITLPCVSDVVLRCTLIKFRHISHGILIPARLNACRLRPGASHEAPISPSNLYSCRGVFGCLFSLSRGGTLH